MANHFLPTVRIMAAGEPAGILINKSCFDESTHNLWVDSESGQEEPTPTGKTSPAGMVELEGFRLEDVLQTETAKKATAAGFGSALAIHRASRSQLEAVNGIGERLADTLKREAAAFVKAPE